MDSNKRFVYEIFISTTPEKLWEALTDGEYTKKCIGEREFRSEWQIGNKVESWMSNGNLDGKGEVLQLKPYELIVYNWNDLGDELEPSIITYKLEKLKNENIVKFTLMHENLLGRSTSYWPVIISDIKSLLETGKSMFNLVDRVKFN